MMSNGIPKGRSVRPRRTISAWRSAGSRSTTKKSKSLSGVASPRARAEQHDLDRVGCDRRQRSAGGLDDFFGEHDHTVAEPTDWAHGSPSGADWLVWVSLRRAGAPSSG